MAYDGPRKLITNGTGWQPYKNITNAASYLQQIVGKRDIDIASPEVVMYKSKNSAQIYKNKSNNKVNNIEINKEVINSLQSINFYAMNNANTTVTHYSQPFTLKYQQRIGSGTSTNEAAVMAWNKIQGFKQNKSGYLHVFDLETYGGIRKDLRFDPAGITEFAMHTYDFSADSNNAISKMNILFTNEETVEKLESLYKRYEDLMSKGGVNSVMRDNEVKVFAMRMGVYDTGRGAKFNFNEDLNIWQAVALGESGEDYIGNQEVVKSGVKQFRKMYEQAKKNGKTVDPISGLPYDQTLAMKSIARMQSDMTSGQGVVMGHNILHFDRGVTSKFVNNIYEQQQAILNSTTATKAQKANAQNAVEYMQNVFNISNGGYMGLSFNKGNALDTLPVMRTMRDTMGLDRTTTDVTLSNLGGIFYPNMEGVAHLGDFDVSINLAMAVDPAEGLNGQSLLEYAMNGITKQNYESRSMALAKGQVFKATNNIVTPEYSGKTFLNYRQYDDGRIITAGGYSLANGVVSYDKYAGNTGFDKNRYYEFKSMNRIHVGSLPEEVQHKIKSAYPEANTEYLYHLAMSSVDATEFTDPHVVNLFAPTAEELEAQIGANLLHVASVSKGQVHLNPVNIDHVAVGTLDIKKGVLTKDHGGDQSLLTRAIKNADIKSKGDAIERAFSGTNNVKNINLLLEFDKKARKAGLGEGLDRMLEDGVSLTSVLKTDIGSKYFNKKQLKTLNTIFDGSVGFKDVTGRMSVDPRRRTNISAKYNDVMSKQAFYSNLVEVTKRKFGVDKIDYTTATDSMGLWFNQLESNLIVNAAESFGYGSNGIKNAVMGTSNYMTMSVGQFKNSYSFELGNKFKLGDSSGRVENVFGRALPENMVTLNLGENNAEEKFITRLYNKYLGDKSKNQNITNKEEYRKHAAAEFLIDLDSRRSQYKDLYANTEFADMMKGIRTSVAKNNKVPDDFDESVAMRILSNAVKESKAINATAGIVPIGDRLTLSSNSHIADAINNYSIDYIQEEAKKVKTFRMLNKNNKEQVVQELVDTFGFNDEMFKKGIEGLDSERVASMEIIRDTVNETLTRAYTDLVNTADKYGIDVGYDAINKVPIVTKGVYGEVLNKLPVAGIENGIMYLQMGNEKVGLDLRLIKSKTKDGERLRIGTNLNEDLGRENFFMNLFDDRFYKNGQIDLGDFNRFFGYHNKETREHSKFDGTLNSVLNLNRRVYTDQAYEMYYDLFKPTGKNHHLLDDIKLVNENLPQIMNDAINNKLLTEKGVGPDLSMVSLVDHIEIVKALLNKDDPNYSKFVSLLDNSASFSNKETQVTKGIFILGQRVASSYQSGWNNTQRPPMAGSGNAIMLDSNKVKQIGTNILLGSVFESDYTVNNYYDSRGDVLSFRGRQLYMSGPMLQERVAENRKIHLKKNINNWTIEQMQEKAYEEMMDQVAESIGSGTFEQARFADGRVLNEITRMPLDTQKITKSKNIFSQVDDDTNMENYQRLINLLGDITYDDAGNIVYKKPSGTIVKKGEVLGEYEGFGGVKEYIGSKHERGVMYFSVANSKHRELTDEQISAILNEHKDEMSALKTKQERLQYMWNVLENKGYDVGYRINNANNASLYKVLDADSEKGMTDALNTVIGRYNKFNEAYMGKLAELGGDSRYDLRNFVANERSVLAIHEDIARKYNMTTEEVVQNVLNKMDNTYGVTNFEGVMGMLRDERDMKSVALFGKGGAFEGFFSVANDAIPKHDNMGLATFGNLSEAIQKYADATGKSHLDATREIVDLMNDKPDEFNFIRRTTGVGGAKFGQDVGSSLTVDVNGTILTQDPRLKGDSEEFLSNERYVNLIKELDARILLANPNATEEERLVHKGVYKYVKKEIDGKEKIVLSDEAEDLIGTFTFKTDEQGRVIATGSTNFASHTIMNDGETVSGVTDRYLSAKRYINSVKGKSDLSPAEEKMLKEAREVVNAEGQWASFNRLSDQGWGILDSEKMDSTFVEDLEASLKLKDGYEKYFTKEKAIALSERTGGLIKFDAKNDTFSIDESIKDKSGYHTYLRKLNAEHYYNDVDSVELTKEMLNTPEYAHLGGIYDRIVGGGYAKKLGVSQAQDFYDMEGMDIAAKFNRANFDKKEMQKLVDEHDFQMMKIEDFVNLYGDARAGSIEGISDKRIILDMGEGFGDNKRYIAIPGGGQKVGDEEVLKVWQGKISAIKGHYESLSTLKGGGQYGVSEEVWNNLSDAQKREIMSTNFTEAQKNKYDRAITGMMNAREEIIDLIEGYPKKGGLYTKLSQIEVKEASERMKIMSVTGMNINNTMLAELGVKQGVDVGSETFMKRAKIVGADGVEKSLFELQNEGAYYDFARTGKDYFKKMGYFEPEMLKKMGMSSEEEMEEYLSTYGTARMVRRFPEIMSSSDFSSRIYLDKQYNGSNIMSVNAATMLKYLGDSDGDSESGWNITYDGINFAMFERSRMKAIKQVEGEGLEKGTAEFRDRVKSIMRNDGISAGAYDAFTEIDVAMTTAAYKDNYRWQSSAEGTLVGDIVSNLKVGDSENLISQLKNAKSATFKDYKYRAAEKSPTGAMLDENMKEVRKAVSLALDHNRQAFEDAGLDNIADLIVNENLATHNIRRGSKYEVLDQTMAVIEDMKASGAMEADTFGTIKTALIQQVQMQGMLEETTAKGTKGAIGSVNNAFGSFKTAARSVFNDPLHKDYDPNKARIMTEFFYQVEQKGAISGKKVAFEPGDSRLLELEKIVGKMKQGNAGADVAQELNNWTAEYLNADSVEVIWNSMRARDRVAIQESPAFKGLEGDALIEAKRRYLSQKIVDSSNTIMNDSIGYSIVMDKAGKRSATAYNISRNTNPSAINTLGGQVQNIVKGNTVGEALEFTHDPGNVAESFLNLEAQDFGDLLTQDVLANSPKIKMNMSAPSFRSGIGIAAIGVAAGLMIAGYAGGGHSRPTKPQDDTQPQVAPMLDDNGQPAPGMQQQGYVINISAESDKGDKHLKRTLKEVAKASASNNNVSINLNYKTTKGGGYSNKDIENIINNYI